MDGTPNGSSPGEALGRRNGSTKRARQAEHAQDAMASPRGDRGGSPGFRGGNASPGRGRGSSFNGDSPAFSRGRDSPAFSRGRGSPAFNRGGDSPAFNRGGGGESPAFSRGRGSPSFHRGGDSPAFNRGGGDFNRGRGAPAFNRGGGDGGRGGTRSGGPVTSVTFGRGRGGNQQQKPKIVVILANAGLWLGNMGLVDAFDKCGTTEIKNESLRHVRPDVVHQTLLSLYDQIPLLNYKFEVCVYLTTIKGRTLELSPELRPPRTYARFKGLIETVLREGSVVSTDGQTLINILPGSIAPVIPHGATVVGLCNDKDTKIVTPGELARQAIDAPVPTSLQGGVQGAAGIYCIGCDDEAGIKGVECVTERVSLSSYPAPPHVLAMRLMEGFAFPASATA